MTGATLAYEVVDVFAGRAFAGNPLAVVLDGDDLTTEQMQAIALEFNLSETTFPCAAPAGATYGLRIFTPGTELPFAGHPSVGSAWVLHRLGRIEAGDNVQACGAGLLPVHVSEDGAMLTGGAASVSDELPADAFLEALGLSADDLAGPLPRSAGVGIPWGFLLVRPEALALVNPDVRRLTALGGTGVSLLSWDGSTARCRVFAGGAGVPEDPATGSAALALGVYLHAAGLLGDGEHPYVVEQGYEMGRPSTLRCTVTIADGTVTRTTVAGSVVPIARGEIRVPPSR
ncbi:MAG: phenazine biosynthesis protein phzf family [Frankiales bacterium]|nr:phenazine biosynthesis protein phzf family [Frankiales bacterium]